MPELKNCRFELLNKNRIELRQDRNEISAACDYLSSKPYDLLIEIGCLHGGSAIVLSGLLKTGSTIVLVDPINRGSAAAKSLKWSCDWLRGQGFKVFLVIGLSFDPKIRRKVHTLAENFQSGLLHIDGDHATWSVLLDYYAFVDCIGPEGAVIFHDVVTNPRVKIAWDQLCQEGHSNRVFYNGRNSTWASGIGVLEPLLFVGASPNG